MQRGKGEIVKGFTAWVGLTQTSSLLNKQLHPGQFLGVKRWGGWKGGARGMRGG